MLNSGRRATLAGVAALLGSGGRTVPAAGQAMPAGPGRIPVGVAPGGGSDSSARLLAQVLSDAFGQKFIVENRPGAAGSIAADLVAKAAPDGATLLLSPASLTSNPGVQPNLPFDHQKDLIPIVQAAIIPKSIAVHPDVPARNILELAAYARSNPQKVSCASAGNGTIGHLSCELFNQRLGTRMVHVGYKGSSAAMQDTISGQVQVLFDDVPTQMPQVRAGKLRILAVTGPRRLAEIPDVPTADESGLKGFFTQTWVGLFAPRETSPAYVARINEVVNQALKTAEVRERLASMGMQPAGGTPSSFAALIASETKMWADVVRSAGLSIGN
mgnify:FL=1